MQNETQNQDTQAAPQQQPVVEEAQAAPEQAMDDTQAATSEVHDDPGVPQQEEQQQQGIAVGEPDPSSPGVEPLSEDALGSSDDVIPDFPEVIPDFPEDETNYGDAGPSFSDVSGFGDDFLSTLPVDDDFSPDFAEDELAGSDPKVTMNLEDLSSPETAQDEPGIDEYNPEDDISGGIWDDPSDDSVITEPGHYWGDPGNSGSWESEPSGTEVASEDPTAGGYDGSGIAGGLGLDQDGMPDNTGINPHVQPDFPGNDPVGQHQGNVMPDEMGTNLDTSEGEGYTYDEGAYEDAEDALENLQDALQDGDEEDLAEALEELHGYLGGFDKGAAEDENPDPTGAGPEEAKDATGDDPAAAGANAQEDPEDLGEGVMEDGSEGGSNPADVDYQEVLHDLDSGNLDEVREFLEGLAGGEEEEAKDAPGGGHEHGHFANEGISLGDIVGEKDEYAYDEEAYEDAEDAFKDLRHALKHGDEEDRAEALQKLQGYLGGFDKGDAEDEAPGLTGGDTEELPNTVDKEAVDAPDASGAAVSGPAVGAAGAAVGAGDTVEDVTNGNFDGALNGATQQAGGAIDGALGIEGSGKVLDQVANGNIEEAYDAVVDYGADKAGDWIGEQLGSEELGDTASEVFNHVANGDFEEAFDTAVDGIGDAAEDLWDSIWD